MAATPITVDANETLNELVARAPETLPVLQRFGLDTCCGGALSLAVAAAHHQLPLAELLLVLSEAIGKHLSEMRTIVPREGH